MLRGLQEVKGGTVDTVINKVLDEVNDEMRDTVWLTGKTTVEVSDVTAENIKSYKISEFESFDDILRRALSIYLNR